MAAKKTTGTTRQKTKEKKNIAQGVAHIQSTFNNTLVSIADVKGEVISWSSAGAIGFKGTKKGTPFAAQILTLKLKEAGLDEDVEIRLVQQGGREAVRLYRRRRYQRPHDPKCGKPMGARQIV